MKKNNLLLFFGCLFILTSCVQAQDKPSKQTEVPAVITDPSNYRQLTEFETYVIIEKGTERAFTGEFHKNKEAGIYICKQCNQPLFSSETKFDSGTGWPSFDDMIENNVTELLDADGRRTEIVCSNCDGHLGHVFKGEGFTSKQTRHCVNSASLNFVSKKKS